MAVVFLIAAAIAVVVVPRIRSKTRHPNSKGRTTPSTTASTIDLATYPGLYPDETHADDNERVLQHILTSVQPYMTILVPRGAIYSHSGDLVLATDHVTIKAEGTGRAPELLSTDVPRPGVKCLDGYPGPCLALTVSGDGDSISDLVIANNHSTTHSTSPAGSGLVLTGDSQTMSNISLVASDGNGIRALGATHLTLKSPAFYMTGATSLLFHPGKKGPTGWVYVANPLISNSGDDGICVESYIGGPRQHDIWVDGETYINTGTPTPGHGIAVVGGTNIYFTNFAVSGSPAAALFVASGQVFHDAGSSGIHFLKGTIKHANTWAPFGLRNGAVLIWSGRGQSIDSIDMENISVSATSPSADYQVGDFAEPTDPTAMPATNVTFKGFTFSGGGPPKLFFPWLTPPKDVQTVDWKITHPDGSVAAIANHPPFALAD